MKCPRYHYKPFPPRRYSVTLRLTRAEALAVKDGLEAMNPDSQRLETIRLDALVEVTVALEVGFNRPASEGRS